VIVLHEEARRHVEAGDYPKAAKAFRKAYSNPEVFPPYPVATNAVARGIFFTSGGVLYSCGPLGENPARVGGAALFAPSASPGADRLVVVDGSGDLPVLALLDLATKGRSVVEKEGIFRDPSWSPDGTEIAVSHCPDSSRPSEADIVILSVETGETRRVTDEKGAEVTPAWSPDSWGLAFSGPCDGEQSIFLADREGEYLHALTHPPQGSCDYSPSFSPDGTEIVFSRRTGLVGALWIVRREGGEERALSTGVPSCFRPAYTPDGKAVVFYGYEERAPAIYRHDLVTGKTKKLVGPPSLPAAEPSLF
jgi:TolB protein